jgi:hypothetical protein
MGSHHATVFLNNYEQFAVDWQQTKQLVELIRWLRVRDKAGRKSVPQKELMISASARNKLRKKFMR